MSANTAKPRIKKRHKAIGIIFMLAGLLLFAYMVEKAGPSLIFAGIQRLGFGFIIVFLLGGMRQAVHAICWVKCCEPPYKLRFRDAFRARLMGEAVGNIVPLGGLFSEASKPLFIRDRIPLTAGISALAIENVFYALSVALFISAGSLALLLSFPLPNALRYISISALVAIALIIPIGALVIRKQLRFISGALGFAGKRGIARAKISDALPRVRTVEDRIYGFYERNHARFFIILLIECLFHVAGVLEAYITLWFISHVIAPTLLTAFILESVNRLINVIFKFIPLRIGVDEGGTGKVASLLGLTNTTGVTLAIVRKARDICWTAIGVALIVRRGISLKAAAGQSEDIMEELTSDDALAVSASESG
ncbi:MAG TPA: lysylphosphatidylglycerol synthase domain-containing protein [Pyrinomonadaceae bacterium]|nr:lysylphosphatidylglycerol synthase domain-containing protein [Pyrinomonadaceae bacterium]